MQKHLAVIFWHYMATLPHIYHQLLYIISYQRTPKNNRCLVRELRNHVECGEPGLPLSRSPVDVLSRSLVDVFVLYSTIVSLLHIRECQILCIILIISPHRNYRPVRSRHHVTWNRTTGAPDYI